MLNIYFIFKNKRYNFDNFFKPCIVQYIQIINKKKLYLKLIKY